MALIQHCLQLDALGLQQTTMQPKSGSWQQYFTDVNETKEEGSSKKQSGQFGDVVFVTRREESGSNVEGDKTVYALKLFKKPLTEEETLRLGLLLRFTQMSLKQGGGWPQSLVRYLQAYSFEVEPKQALLMDFVDGLSMKTMIDEQRIIAPPQQWSCWMRDVFLALSFLHKNGITHRDVHPGNIIVRKNGIGAVLVDLDLMCSPQAGGLCRNFCFGPATTKSTAPDLWCLRDAMAAKAEPEQWYRSDIWGAANSFLSYLYSDDLILTRKLHYTQRDASCTRRAPPSIEQAVESSLWLVPESLRLLFAQMLSADWTKRPTADQALQVLGQCLIQGSAPIPGVFLMSSGENVKETVYEDANAYVPANQ